MANYTGERNNKAKLTQSQVIAMRMEKVLNNETNESLAKRYGLHPNYVAYIINRRTWKHI